MRLDDRAVQQFLASRYIAVLATLQPDGAPLATPMWFVHDAAHVTMLSVEATHKVRNLRRDPRVSMAVETSGPSGSGGRGVIIQGRAEFLAESPERAALVERFHARYPELAKFWGGRAMPANRVMFRITPSSVGGWGLE